MADKSGKSGDAGKRGRSAKDGRFVPQKTVRRNPDTTVNETIKPKNKGK